MGYKLGFIFCFLLVWSGSWRCLLSPSFLVDRIKPLSVASLGDESASTWQVLHECQALLPLDPPGPLGQTSLRRRRGLRAGGEVRVRATPKHLPRMRPAGEALLKTILVCVCWGRRRGGRWPLPVSAELPSGNFPPHCHLIRLQGSTSALS